MIVIVVVVIFFIEGVCFGVVIGIRFSMMVWFDLINVVIVFKFVVCSVFVFIDIVLILLCCSRFYGKFGL